MAKTTSKNPQVGKITDEEERKKALSNTLGAIEKQFGKGAIMKLGDKHRHECADAIPSGCLELDMALGVGGVPRGRIIEIYGPESSGKTTVALHMVARGAEDGRRRRPSSTRSTRWIPSMPRRWAWISTSCYVSQPDTGEQALEIC